MPAAESAAPAAARDGAPAATSFARRLRAVLSVLLVVALAGRLADLLILVIAAVVFGVRFGVVGVFFATPLMVVVMVMLRQLDVEDLLEQRPPSACTADPAR